MPAVGLYDLWSISWGNKCHTGHVERILAAGGGLGLRLKTEYDP